MCCHLNGSAPPGRCINSVISIPEVTKGLAGKFIFAGGYTVVLSSRQPRDGAGEQVYEAARIKKKPRYPP